MTIQQITHVLVTSGFTQQGKWELLTPSFEYTNEKIPTMRSRGFSSSLLHIVLSKSWSWACKARGMPDSCYTRGCGWKALPGALRPCCTTDIIVFRPQ